MNKLFKACFIVSVFLTITFSKLEAQYPYFENEFKLKTNTTFTDYTNISKVLVGDFNGDLRSDIAYLIGNTWNLFTSSGKDCLTYSQLGSYPSGFSPTKYFAGDFDGDGLCDILSKTANGWYVSTTYEEKTSSGYSYKLNPPTLWLGSVDWYGSIDPLIGDFNGDGMKDIAICNYLIDYDSFNWTIYISNNHAFTYNRASVEEIFEIQKCAAGDFNGDGVDDKAVLDSYNTWHISLTSGTTPWNASNGWACTGAANTGIFVGDFNGDSKSDIGYSNSSNEIWALTSTGSNFSSARWAVGQGNHLGLFAGDFDGDGWCDKVQHVGSTDPSWNGFWIAYSHNSTPPQVGVTYWSTYYKNPDETVISGWANTQRDIYQTPVVGWGNDVTTGIYSCQDTSTVRRQVDAMHKIGFDFIMANLTDGYYPLRPSIKTNSGVYEGDGCTRNGLTTLFNVVSGRPYNIKVAIASGVEFWGKFYFDNRGEVWKWNTDGHGDPNNPADWTEQKMRQEATHNSINADFIKNGMYAGKYFTYLGKPLWLQYIEGANNTIFPKTLWHFNDVTQRSMVQFRETFGRPVWGGLAGTLVWWDGIDTKRWWGWGAGAVDDGAPGADAAINKKPLPYNEEIMSVMPGCRMFNDANPNDYSPTVYINRKGGNFYMNQWKQVLSVKPKIVLVADWNQYTEGTGIEACVGANGWKDRWNNPAYDWYYQITAKYIKIYKNDCLPLNEVTYVREEGSNLLCEYPGMGSECAILGVVDTVWNLSQQKILNPQRYPSGQPDILLPFGWLSRHGYNSLYKRGVSDDVPSYEFDAASYPNPFNPSVNISFSIPTTGNATLKIYNMLGKEVAVLINGEVTEGSHKVTWSPTDMSSGIYIYRLTWNNNVISKKIMFLK
ncbi:MAG: T9SS type A sorting domain-containing protein [Acidobacteriota bacterium]